jgi:hypothetical protein
MKKILLTSLMSVGALGASAQGTLNFTDYVYGKDVSHIWSPSSTAPTVGLTGNDAANDTPAGSASYTGSTMLGGKAVNGSAANPTYQNGNNWTVQLEALGSSGTSVAVPLSSLLPVTQYTTHLNTSGAAGNWTALSVANDPGIPGAGGTTPSADIANAAWYNGGGTGDATLAAAKADVLNGVWGESAEVVNFQVTAPSSITGNPPGFNNPDNATSFRLQTNATPEPSSIALGLMAAGAFIARRRKS